MDIDYTSLKIGLYVLVHIFTLHVHIIYLYFIIIFVYIILSFSIMTYNAEDRASFKVSWLKEGANVKRGPYFFHEEYSL